MIATCGRTPAMMPPTGGTCPPVVWPSESDYQALEQHLREIAQGVRRRAPQATVVFVEYVRIVPETGACADVPLDQTQLVAARETFRRMFKVTKKAASAEGALFLPIGQLSKGHGACSSNHWRVGSPGTPSSWHPTAAVHKAIAEALFRRLK